MMVGKGISSTYPDFRSKTNKKEPAAIENQWLAGSLFPKYG